MRLITTCFLIVLFKTAAAQQATTDSIAAVPTKSASLKTATTLQPTDSVTATSSKTTSLKTPATKPSADVVPTSPLGSMSYEQYKAYSDGIDINHLDLIAAINHYPSAQKVLSLKKQLLLTADQTAQISAINTELNRKLKEMGAFIIKNEKTMDDLFRSKQINDGSLIFYANRYGLYIGEMRNAMLQTYLKVQNILSAGQLKKYVDLQKP